ncbi:MAG TPA: hypothetical protein PLI60_04280 [Anaerolineaceae bacterium]|nr:hypothetical protein [Anaerolineaceae bacterium]HQN05440.1 hypothetical protein [Anaerolineaceae bacterium]HQP08652.1 hypothetical protein [Anaerolineaceae bacterium]
MITIGLVLMILGIVLPFLMVMDVIESTFFLNFFSYIISLVGMLVASVGAIMWGVSKRNERR